MVLSLTKFKEADGVYCLFLCLAVKQPIPGEAMCPRLQLKSKTFEVCLPLVAVCHWCLASSVDTWFCV